MGWGTGSGKWEVGDGEVGNRDGSWSLEKNDLVFEFGSLVCHTISPFFGEAVVVLTSKGMWPFAHLSLIILIFLVFLTPSPTDDPPSHPSPSLVFCSSVLLASYLSSLLVFLIF